ncbi:MAG: cysteine desulfurase family protein [Pseudobdellovibrionaceae bacterium]
MKQIYLDFNASTPVAPEVRSAMEPYWNGFVGNPSSQHWAGVPYKEALNKARRQIANLLGCSEDEVVFTSGGSESNNHAIKGTFFGQQQKGKHIITTAIEHPAVVNPCEYLRSFGADITYIPVDSLGRINPDDVQKAIRKDTVLITVMHSNNEVGTIQPIEEVSRIAKEHGVAFHSDAAQSVGKVPVKVNSLGVDLLTIAGHKFYGPKGVGALFIRKGTKIDPLIHGAGHEGGRRAGTENVPLCVGLGVASELAETSLVSSQEKLRTLRDRLWTSLKEIFAEKVFRNGHLDHCLPNTLSISFAGLNGNNLLSQIPSIAVSTGSACHSGQEKLSSVLVAMGIPEHIGIGTIRFSLGRTTTEDEIREVVSRLTLAILSK